MNHQVAVKILPSREKDEILAVSENATVVLRNSPKAPLLFPVDLVLSNLDTDLFLNKFSESAIDQLTEGNDVSLMFYDAAPTNNNRFDMTSLIYSFSSLFDMIDYEIYLTFTEFKNDNQVDLLSSQMHQEYRIDAIDLALKYYEYGLDQHTRGNVSIFSIILKYQCSPSAQINLIDLSGCGQGTRQQFLLSDAPWTHIYNQSATAISLICVHPSDPTDQLQQTLTFAHQIHTNKIVTLKSTSMSLSKEGPESIRRIILNNQVKNNSLISTSSSLSSFDTRHFSNTSTSTSHTTLNDDITPEDAEHAITRVKELENKLHQMQCTQEQLVEINDKQAQLVQYLETEHYQRQQEMKELATERQELDRLVQVFEQRLSKNDQETARALEELDFIRQKSSPLTDSLTEQRTQVLEIRIKELEEWQNTHTSEAAAKEKKWHDELDIHRQALRSGDNSGIISALESRIHALHVEKRTQQADFKAALKNTKQLQQEDQEGVHPQHKKRQSMDQVQWLSWLEQTQSPAEVAATLAEMSLENAQLAASIDDLENQMSHQRHRLSHQLNLLESDMVKLTVANHQLERALDQHNSQQNSSEDVITPLRSESRQRKSRGSTNSNLSKKARDRSCSVGSEDVSQGSLKRSSAPSIPPPPTDPPSQPLPPVPDSQQHTISQLETKLSAFESEVADLKRQLNQERELKQRAEKAHHILEKRLEESHTQKNKFRCF